MRAPSRATRTTRVTRECLFALAVRGRTSSRQSTGCRFSARRVGDTIRVMPYLHRFALGSLGSLALLALAACDNPPATMTPADAGPEDGGPPSCDIVGLGFSHASLGVTVGATRESFVELRRDTCLDLPVTIESSGAGSISGAPSGHTFVPLGTTRFPFTFTGASVGDVVLTARTTSPNGTMYEATMRVAVTDGTIPPCAGSASGRVTAGGEVAVASGMLASVGVGMPAGAARDDLYHVDPFDAAVACAPDQLPADYIALGPAIAFTSGDAYRFRREIDFAIPISLALLPNLAHRGHVELAYTGPGISTARIVPIADPRFEGEGGWGLLRFRAPRLGTYQAVARASGPRTRMRTFNYRGIMGFSMGGSGSGRIGFGNPDLFDFVAPLGGPTEWTYLLEYIRRYHLGGFCTAAEWEADATRCTAASLARAPDRGELYEHVQHFEHWWYEDDYDGQGGTFDRADYIDIFRDLAAMFGNPNSDTSEDDSTPNILPPGVPDSIRMMSDSARCAADAQIVIAPEPVGGDKDSTTGYFDDEYNPRGIYPVITFCDGAQQRRMDGETDVGLWDPTGTQSTPIEVGVAVDWNRNGLRDPGEPVIRNGREPFDDFGLDGVPSAMEAGYDPLTNPDPAGDDYDYQYNPTGTEGNWDRDGDPCVAGAPGVAEPFRDVGIDGVPSTPQLSTGGYDVGEGNGCFDRTRGADRMIASSPLAHLRGYESNHTTVTAYTDDELDRFDVIVDGGVRDLFNWVVMGHHTIGGYAARGRPVRFWNGHAALHMDSARTGDRFFAYSEVAWEEVGRHSMIRYGSIDADDAALRAGDGQHVGTVPQLQNRVFSALSMMGARWPDGDRRLVRDTLCTFESSACPRERLNSFTVDFTSPTTGRTGPMSVVLPPGYFDESYADTCYPVVYFLHGYGMEPDGLRAIGILLWNEMISPFEPAAHRVPKMIFVFPDGRCRGGECLRGTFYTNAPDSTPNGAQMQTFMLDFMEYMEANYRICPSRTVEVRE